MVSLLEHAYASMIRPNVLRVLIETSIMPIKTRFELSKPNGVKRASPLKRKVWMILQGNANFPGSLVYRDHTYTGGFDDAEVVSTIIADIPIRDLERSLQTPLQPGSGYVWQLSALDVWAS